jgi:hypothetical protein
MRLPALFASTVAVAASALVIGCGSSGSDSGGADSVAGAGGSGGHAGTLETAGRGGTNAETTGGGGGGAGGNVGTVGGGGGAAGSMGGAGTPGSDGGGGTAGGGSRLSDCAGLICGSDQQVVNVRNPALGTTQCGCSRLPSDSRCADCDCGASLCAEYGATCLGFSLERGLLCTERG